MATALVRGVFAMTAPPFSVVQIGTADRQGGAATVSWALHRALDAGGVDARMLVGVKRSLDPRVRAVYDTAAGRLLRRLTGRDVRRALHRRLAPWLADDVSGLPRRCWLTAPELAAADIVHAHNLHGFFFNLKVLPELSRRKPFVWTLHDMWPMTSYWIHAFDCPHWPERECYCDPPNTLPPLRWNNSRRLWRLKADVARRSRLHLVAPSEWMRRQVQRGMLRGHPVRVIANGVDVDRFRPGDRLRARAELGLPADGSLVLYVGKDGRANPWKGWSHAVEAVRALGGRRDVRFVFVGGGIDPDLAVVDAGLLKDPGRLAEYFRACDVLLYPSLADNCPLAVLEAMASGLPVVTFATGGIPELVRDGVDGVVVAGGDTAALIAGLAGLLDDPAKRESEGAQARSRVVDHFGLERMVDAYLDLYRELSKVARSAVGRRAVTSMKR